MSETAIKPEALTRDTFIEKVFDYTTEKEWNYKGSVPCVIDFWAEWCGPCRMLAPIFEELAGEYNGTVQFYKVDTETEQELASVFGIRSIPSLLFIPVNGKPQMAAGAYPKEMLKEIIEKELVNPSPDDNEEDAAQSAGVISTEELRGWLESNENLPVLLDVRFPDEHAQKCIPNSILIPLPELEERIGELEQYKDREIVVYCRSGNRSGTACDILAPLGYNVMNLTGGMLAW
ncbi:MAG: thioredoxin [Candidatus Kapaibacterium sp.]|nr:thioredoxin [Bacteroidota bacterium]